MQATDIILETIWEDGDATNLARVHLDGSNITQAGITTIIRKIFDLDTATPTTAIDTTSLTIASAVFDTLQTDDRWTEDSTGYNFRDVVAGSEYATANHRYRVEYVFTSSGGAVFPVVYILSTQELYSS